MKRHKVSDDKNVTCTANGWLQDQEQFFYNGMRTLEKPWTMCMLVAGRVAPDLIFQIRPGPDLGLQIRPGPGPGMERNVLELEA